MINLYRDLSFFGENEVLDDPEMFFINRISASDLSPELDIKSSKVETPFGICSIDDISTGCKVAVCVVYLNEHRKDFDTGYFEV